MDAVPGPPEVTRMLDALRQGDDHARQELFRCVYRELHRLAQRERAGWHGDHTMNTTALVHEAYLRLVSHEGEPFANRAHFMGVAARAMRHILIDYARRKRAEKRGGAAPHLSIDDPDDGEITLSDERAEELVALDEALERLSRFSERQSRIVECRFFGGMTVEETAEALGISAATVKRGWAMAQAWLYRELQA